MAQGPVKKLDSERTRIERYGDDGTLPQETTDALCGTFMKAMGNQ